MNTPLENCNKLFEKIYNKIKASVRLFFLFIFNPQKYYSLFLYDYKINSIFQYTFRMIIYSFIVFSVYIILIIKVLCFVLHKNFSDVMSWSNINNNGIILVFLTIFVLCIFYLCIFNISFKSKKKVLKTVMSSIIINFYPALFFSAGLLLAVLYDYYKLNNFIIIGIIISIMISDPIKYLINMNTYNKLKDNSSDNTYYYRYINIIRRLSRILMIIGLISFIFINILNGIIYLKDYKAFQLIVIIIIFTGILLLKGFMDTLYTFCILILTFMLNVNNISYDIIYRNLPVVLSSIHNPIKLGKFDVTYGILRAIKKHSCDNSLEIAFMIMQIGMNKLASVRFISNELNNKNIEMDSLIRAIYLYGINKQNFEELLRMLDEKNRSIFESIYNLDNFLRRKSEEELLIHLRNTQFLIKKTYKNTQYEKLLQYYIELLKINKIEMFSSLRRINTQYDIFNFHPNIFDELINVSIISEEYLNPQISKENRLASLNRIINILSNLKGQINNSKNYPSKFILLNALSSYLDIIYREVYYFKKRASIDLKILSSKVYYARKDKVSIPFVISNRGYANAKNLLISIKINSNSINSNTSKYKIEELLIDQYKDFQINIKINESGPMDLFVIVSYDVENTGNYKELFKFSIITESNGKIYVPVEDNFITGMVIHDETKFIGRKDYIKTIRDNIHTTSIIIHGNRRIGKTSLLCRIKDGVLGKSVHAIFFDMQQLSLYDDSLDLLKYMIDKICDCLCEKGFKLDIIYNKDDNLKYKEIAGILENINNVLKDNILVLLFDEFEYFEKFIKNSDEQFQNLWRSMIIDYSNIRYIFSGFLSLNRYSFWSEIGMVAKSIQMEKFTIHETKELFQIYLKDSIVIEDTALNKIYEVTGGHPYLLQCLGSNMVNYVNSIKEPYILLEDVEEIKKGFLISDNSFFKWVWYSLMDDIERKELINILKNNDPSEPAIRLNSSINKNNLDSLFTEKKIIFIYSNQIEFTIPLFKDWIKMQIIM